MSFCAGFRQARSPSPYGIPICVAPATACRAPWRWRTTRRAASDLPSRCGPHHATRAPITDMWLREFLNFRHLRTRLAVLYAGLFAVAMLCVFALLYGVVQHNAEAQVRKELVANGTVYDRLWSQQTAQLRSAAGLLARDFGFRAAVATHDRNTIESALANLRERLGLSTAFIVDIDAR